MKPSAALAGIGSALDSRATYMEDWGAADYSPTEVDAMERQAARARDLADFLESSLDLIRNPRLDSRDAIQFVEDLRGYLR